MSFKEELVTVAKQFENEKLMKDAQKPAYNPNYKKLVRFKNKLQEDSFDRLPLTDRQKEKIVYDHIGLYRYYA